MRARWASALGIVSTLGLFVGGFSCNAVTGIGDYAVTCRGCVEQKCPKQVADCETDQAECGRAEGCFLGCFDQRLTLPQCQLACTPAGGDPTEAPPTVQAIIECIDSDCHDLCFAAPGASVTPPDVGVDARDADATD